MTNRTTRLAGLFFVLIASLVAGCGDDDGGGTGGCPNCEFWEQLTFDQGRFPAVHPTRNAIAYSSSRGTVDAENEDIWIREAVGNLVTYHRVTDDAGDEHMPSWSPDGRRLSFARFSGGRWDVWIVDVADFSHPTDLQRVTSPDLVEHFPGRSDWRDNNTLIFTNGDDLYQIPIGATSRDQVLEIVPDPADAIQGLGLRFIENQPSYTPVSANGHDWLAFISEGRGPQGSIQVNACGETGELVTANISVDGKPLLNPNLDTLRTPILVSGVGPADYVVGVKVSIGPDDYCDTTLVQPLRVFPNQTTVVNFQFDRPRGAIRVLGPPIGESARVFVYPLAGGGVIPTGTISSDTTMIGCLFEGDYRCELVQAEVFKDSVTVHVCERRISQVCLSVSASGCPDSLGLTVDCIDTLITTRPDGTLDCSGLAVAHAKFLPDPSLAPAAPAQEQTDLWIHDLADTAETTLRLTTSEVSEKFPSWSPDGLRIAFIEDHIGELFLQIVNVETGAFRSVPLPGRATTRLCGRGVAHPTWTPDGLHLIVSLTNCTDEIETNEVTDLWSVDVSAFLP